MESLTEIITLPPGKKIPLLLEAPLHPELDGPFLVTSTKSVVWTNKFPNGRVRAAVRKFPLEFLFREMLISFADKAHQELWGNLLPTTAEGLEKAIAHLAEYEILQVEILWGTGFDENLLPKLIPAAETTWVPRGCALVVSTDRALVGSSFELGDGHWAGVLHNPSRGMALLTPGGLPGLVPDP